MAKFTTNGFEIDGIVSARQKLIDKAVEKFLPLLNGQELATGDNGIIGRTLGIISEVVALQEEAIQDFVTATDPNQASDNNLDDLLALSGEVRLGASPASAFLLVFGSLGTTIPAGASARSKTTGDVFNLANEVTFKSTETNGVEIEVTTLLPNVEYTIQYAVEGKQSVNAPISVLTSVDDDKKALALRLVQTINSQTSDLQARLTNTNNIEVYIINRLDVGSFTISSNLTTLKSYMPVEADSATYSAIAQQPNTITSINAGAVIGWDSVLNPYVTTASNDVETDEDARYRWYLTKTSDAFGDYDSLYSALYKVKGVKFINIQQNITSKPNGERTNQGIVVVVLGGNGNDIAQTIFNNLSIGTVTDGIDQYYALDINGSPHEIRLSRPSFTPIQI